MLRALTSRTGFLRLPLASTRPLFSFVIVDSPTPPAAPPCCCCCMYVAMLKPSIMRVDSLFGTGLAAATGLTGMSIIRVASSLAP